MRERGLSFSAVERFDFEAAYVREDTRNDYGERRFMAIGPMDGLTYVVVFTRRGEDTRVISFRRANDREVEIHARRR